MRADLLLVHRGLATTRSQAQRLIASGVQWRVDDAWRSVAKNGDEVPEHAELQVPDRTEAKYISRGGLKLEGALQQTGLAHDGVVQNARCLDVGQSTGGFTDCLLQHGAKQVVGIEVGHGQLHPSLLDDRRVVSLEGVNARSLTLQDLGLHLQTAETAPLESNGELPALFDFLTADLSFISLTLVLPAMVRLLKPQGHALLLVKPQFELQPGQVGKGGLVHDAALFAQIEQKLRGACAELGLQVLGWLESPIAGGQGQREFFIHAQKTHVPANADAPLTVTPARQAPKRLPRSALRRPTAPEIDLHAGQPGPARRKQRSKDTKGLPTNNPNEENT